MIKSWVKAAGELRVVGNPLSDKVVIASALPVMTLSLAEIGQLITVLQQAQAQPAYADGGLQVGDSVAWAEYQARYEVSDA